MLDAIGGALRLTGPERAYLYLLAGLNPPRAGRVRGAAVTPELRHPLDAWTPQPAMLRDRYWNLLAINDAPRMVLGYGDTDHNCLFTFVTNARYRSMHLHWAPVAPAVVAAFRAEVDAPIQAVKAVHHPEAGDLVFDLTTLAVADRPDWYLELYNSRPGAGTGDRLERLLPIQLAAPA